MRRTVFHIRHISALFAFLLFVPGRTAASYISIDTAITAGVRDNRTSVSLVITNKGDEAAHNVLAIVEAGGKTARGALKEVLGVNESLKEQFGLETVYAKPGRYPFVVTVEYTDANLYPFTALSVAHLNYKDPGNARVVCAAPPLKIIEKGRQTLSVTNMDDAPRTVHVRLAAARELSVARPETDVVLGPGAKKDVQFDLGNTSALPGSSYPVYGVITYEDGERFNSYICSGALTVEKEGIARRLKTPLLVAFIVFAVLAVVYYLRERRLRAGKG